MRAYDSLGRLTSVTVRRGTCMPWPSDSTASDSLSSSFGWRYTCGTVASDSGATYSYDAVGNRTDHGAVIATGDRLMWFGDDSMAYDDDGNMTSRHDTATGEDHRYVWNALGQLDSAIVVSAIDPISGQRTTVTEHYLYDASGRLVHVDGSPNTGWLVYQGDQVSEVVQSPSGYTDVAYDDGTDRPAMEYIHTLPSDEWRAQVVDPMGNLAGTVNLDSIGVPHTWDAWGRNTSTTWDGMDALGWKGLQPETGTGLIYMRARWYDPTLGRFISEDPAGLAGGINPYVFAGDDPINQSDPSGRYTCAGVTINGTDCGDPLQMPGSMSSAASGAFGWGGGDVSYGGTSGIAISGLLSGPPKGGSLWDKIKRTIRTIAVGVAIGAGWETSDKIEDPPPPPPVEQPENKGSKFQSFQEWLGGLQWPTLSPPPVVAPPPPVWLPLAGLPWD